MKKDDSVVFQICTTKFSYNYKMIDYIEKNFGEKIGASIFFFLIAVVTVNIPDWDSATGKLLLHRSIITHSILITLLLDFYSKKNNFHEIDGSENITEITRKIEAFVNV